MAPGGQVAGAKVGISTVAAADGGEGGAGIATAAAGTGGGGSGSGRGGGTGTGAGTGIVAAPVMLGARAIGRGVDAGSTLGGLVPAVPAAVGGGRSSIGAHAPTHGATAAMTTTSRAVRIGHGEIGASSMFGTAIPSRCCSPADYNLPARHGTTRQG
jgi:hypothetical protein